MNRTAYLDKPQFCPLCEVVLDLHDGPGSCDSADAKARLLETFPFGRVR